MRKEFLYAGMAAMTLQLMTFSPARAAGPDHDEVMKHDPEFRQERVDELSSRLKLTVDQKKKIEAVLEAKREKVKALHEEFMTKRKAIAEETDQDISSNLNDKQKTEYAKMKEEMKKRHEGMRSKRMERMDRREGLRKGNAQ